MKSSPNPAWPWSVGVAGSLEDNREFGVLSLPLSIEAIVSVSRTVESSNIPLSVVYTLGWEIYKVTFLYLQ